MIGVTLVEEHQHVGAVGTPARRRVEVDHHLDAVLLRPVENLRKMVQLPRQPAVVFGEVEFGADLPPVAHDLVTEQIDVPRLEGLEIVLGHRVRRHHSPAADVSGEAFRIAHLELPVDPVVRAEQFERLHGIKVEFHLPGTVFQAEDETSVTVAFHQRFEHG
ncbi:hypothetical protein SDC9_156793 [bioreactor metagenome]|uniref:Uncharacterized protein n=1 Tax=bioreactor metagenome TaxID=1076179 RepID=A0A645FAL4_9ZZZZ